MAEQEKEATAVGVNCPNRHDTGEEVDNANNVGTLSSCEARLVRVSSENSAKDGVRVLHNHIYAGDLVEDYIDEIDPGSSPVVLITT